MNLSAYLENVLTEMKTSRRLAEGALAQITDEQFFHEFDHENNTIAIIVRHIAGNMRSRWRDFLDSDGEKPDRNRDGEFITTTADSRDAIMAEWSAGWEIMMNTLKSLTPANLDKVVKIRREDYTVFAAINRQLTHYAYHVGQIVFMARHLVGESWQSLSIPRGESDTFNKKMGL